MNRHQRRAAAKAAKARAAADRHDAVRLALAYMATRSDPSISGATLFLPDGQMLYVPAEAARTKPMRGGLH